MSKLKMNEEHQQRLSMLLQEFGSDKLEHYAFRYRDGNFPRADKCKDKALRYCFDIFHALVHRKEGLVSDLYKYLNDDNIYSYLKKSLSHYVSIVNGGKA